MNETDYWNKLWAKPSQATANNFAVRAYKIIKTKHYSKLLDLGCGDGRDSIYFSSKGLKVTGIDFSQIAMDRVKIQNPDVQWIQQDIRNIEFKEQSFDIIYSHLSLQYFDDETTNQIVGKLYKILANNGLLFIKCKSIDDQKYGQGEKVGEDLFMAEHLRHFFSKEYMLQILHQFKIIKVIRTSSTYSGYKSAFIEAVATK